MTVKRKVRLKITTQSRQAIVTWPAVFRTRCPVCEREVEMLTTSEAARVLEVDNQTLDALIADGQVHAIKTVSGNLRICKESLFAEMRRPKAE